MTVKVIGKDETLFKRVTCKNCASRLQYVKKDVKSYVSYDYGGGSDTYFYIDCPSCEEKVNVSYY